MNVKEIISRIGYFRTKSNLSARELSRRLGNDESYITRLESFSFNLTIVKLLDILEILNVSPAEFFADNYMTYKEDLAMQEDFSIIPDDDKKAIQILIKRFKK